MKKSVFVIILLAIVLSVSACGTKAEKPEGDLSSATNKQTATSAPSVSPAQTSEPKSEPKEVASQPVFPREVTSANGSLTIEKQPLKVGLAHWGYVEMLFPFDLPAAGLTLPFAAANSSLESDVYKPYADKFDELVVVGENTQVNLEAMLAFEPDVILAGSNSGQAIAPQLEQIAQTVWVDEEKVSLRKDWPAIVTLIGNVLGQEERAKEVIDQFIAKQEEGKQKLANRLGETVLFVQVREKAVYTHSVEDLPQYYGGLGLTPPGIKLESGQVTLEGLAEIDPDHLFLGYFNWTDKSLPALTDEWENSEVWKSLKAVKNNQVYAFNGELALGIGPIGQSYGLDTIVEAMQ